MDANLLALLADDSLASVWLLLAPLLVARARLKIGDKARQLQGSLRIPILDRLELHIEARVLQVVLEQVVEGVLAVAIV